MGLLSSGVLTSYLAMLGAFDIESDYTNPESKVFFVLFLFLIVVIMLNLLIALMADTFERVMESWVFESRKMRVEKIIEQELLMNDSDNTDSFPAFLQVLRPVEEVADEWAGVSGQISAVRDEVGAVKREVGVVKTEVNTVKTDVMQQVDALAAEMKEMKAEMRANQELVMEQLRSMAMQNADPYLY
jgi:archaellum component FlaC